MVTTVAFARLTSPVAAPVADVTCEDLVDSKLQRSRQPPRGVSAIAKEAPPLEAGVVETGLLGPAILVVGS